MEIYTDRVIFSKVLNKLGQLGEILNLSLLYGGVDNDSLNKMKDVTEELNKVEFESFINEWLEEGDARGYLHRYIKKVWQMHHFDSTKYKIEELGEDYTQAAAAYDRVRNTIVWMLSNYLKDGEMVDEKGSIYRIDKSIEDSSKEPQLNEEQEAIFEELIENGYMSKTDTGYKWNGTNALLAYTMEKIFCVSNTDTFPETMLNGLFDVKRLGQSRSQLYNSRNKPRGADEIDVLLGI